MLLLRMCLGSAAPRKKEEKMGWVMHNDRYMAGVRSEVCWMGVMKS
jgi:hypothetical protein